MALDFGLLGTQGLNPLQMATQGYASGLQMRMAEDAMAQQQQQQQQAQQLAQQQEEIKRRALAGDVAAQVEHSLGFVKNAKEAVEAFGMLDKPKKDAARTFAYQLDSAARTSPELYTRMVNDRVTALENSPPTPENQQEIAYMKSLQLVPQDERWMHTLQMVGLADGVDNAKKYADAIIAGKQAPFELAKSQADAQKAAVAGQYAEPLAMAELEEKKANTQLKVAEAQLKKLESSGYMTPEQKLRADKLRLEIGELESKKQQSVADKQNAFESAVADFDSTLDTLYTLKNHEGMSSALGPIDSRFPSLGQEAIDFEKQLEKLQSQQFLTAVAKVGSMAGLTEVEGKKLQSAIGALDIKMQPETFNREVNKIVKKIEDMKALTAKKYGQKMPDKNQVSSRGQGFDLIKKAYPDASDEQINAYLAQQGL